MISPSKEEEAIVIEAGAKGRLADEYDAAQERGEIRKQADNQAYSKAEKAQRLHIVAEKKKGNFASGWVLRLPSWGAR